jgi:hypothetical protein
VFKLVNAVKSMRVSPQVELEGLDVPQFDSPAYPDDVIAVPHHGGPGTPVGTPSASMTSHPAQNPAG